ncbi:MAG TPA: hypothetical protein VF476_08670 [Chitinophagaceae bacterium]
MKQLLFFILLLQSLISSAQSKKEVFEIAAPGRRVGGAIYNSIRLVDLRPDPEDFGLVQIGAFDRTEKVVVQIPLEEQLKKLVSRLSLSTSQAGELVLVIRYFSFAEVNTPLGVKGYCYLRAVLFGGNEERYRRLDIIDTAVLVKTMDPTQPMLRKGSKLLTDFIADNLIRAAVDSQVYTFNQLYYIDKIEKAKLPAYSTISYPDGLYKTYEDFANLRPTEATLKVSFSKKGDVRLASRINDKGKPETLNPKDAYAFVFEGKPYIVTEYGYYILKRKVGDFYFTGRAKNQGDEPDIITATFFFGILGTLLASEMSSYLEMKVDYLSGGFIRLRPARE